MRASRLVLVCLVSVSGAAGADEPATDITEISLEDLLEADIDVASRVPQTYRETPGVITVITREEIMDSGARDLEDVLLLVPGFSPGVDVEAVTGIGVRGNWGHEGKVLLLIDGQQMNETLFSTNQLGNHYPVDQIQRIEIIRGPGSAIYGGYAELAVINVITRGADDLKGAAVYLHSGRMADAFSHNSISVAAGDTLGPVKLSLAGFFGRGHRSDQDYTDFYDNTFNLEEHRLDPLFINLGAQYRGFSARFLYDNYRIDEADGLGENEAMTIKQNFIGAYAELKYDAKIKSGLIVTPKVNYTRQLPWRVLDSGSAVFYDKTGERMTAGVSASWDARKGLNLLGGVEVYRDHAFLNQPSGPDAPHTQFGTADSVTYTNLAAYAQGLLNHPIANLTVGLRFENHSEFGSSFVPRIALTKVIKPIHFKLLFSSAFRAPGFENINLATDPAQMKPERTYVAEAEVGAAIGAHHFVTLNAYFIRINDPIVYFINMDGSEGYQNFPRTGTLGLEAVYKLRYGPGYLNASYSFYRARGNEVPVYEVPLPDASGYLLGMPAHKLALQGAYRVWKNLRIGPSLVMTAKHFAMELPGDGMGVGTPGKIGVTTIANLMVTYPDLGVKGLEAGIGVRNILDDNFEFAQPYDGGHAPMRGASRMLLLRLGYTRPF